jgi:uncharacterized FlaG/YvyC family protein
MEIGPVNRVDMSAPVTSLTTSQDWTANDRQVVAGIQWLKQAEWLGQDREFTYRHDHKTGRFVIQIVDTKTGDVVDQIPSENIVKLVSEMQAQLQPKDE